jgi:hypothetical protein
VTVLSPTACRDHFAALEPGSGKRSHALGWRVTYDFLPVDDGRRVWRSASSTSCWPPSGRQGRCAPRRRTTSCTAGGMYALEFGLAAADGGV